MWNAKWSIPLAVLVLFLVAYTRRRKPIIYLSPEYDVRDNIVNYLEEGGGEEDQHSYDITRLRKPILPMDGDSPSRKPLYPESDTPMGRRIPRENGSILLDTIVLSLTDVRLFDWLQVKLLILFTIDWLMPIWIRRWDRLMNSANMWLRATECRGVEVYLHSSRTQTDWIRTLNPTLTPGVLGSIGWRVYMTNR